MGKHNHNIFLQQLNNKNIDAFKLLYNYYYKVLVVYSMQFVDREEVAKDLVQELFISLWEQELKFDSPLAVKNYIYKSIRNRSLNYLKHEKVQGKYIQLMKEKGEDTVDLYLEFEEQEIYRQIFAAIDGLPPRCKEIFEMHLQGKKNIEIAGILKLSVETVKTQKKKAMRHLRKKMGALFTAFVMFSISA